MPCASGPPPGLGPGGWIKRFQAGLRVRVRVRVGVRVSVSVRVRVRVRPPTGPQAWEPGRYPKPDQDLDLQLDSYTPLGPIHAPPWALFCPV